MDLFSGNSIKERIINSCSWGVSRTLFKRVFLEPSMGPYQLHYMIQEMKNKRPQVPCRPHSVCRIRVGVRPGLQVLFRLRMHTCFLKLVSPN